MVSSRRRIITLLIPVVVLVILHQHGYYMVLTSHVATGRQYLTSQFSAPRPLIRVSRDNDDSSAPLATGSTNHHPLCPWRTPRSFPRFSYPSFRPTNWTTFKDVTSNIFTTFHLVNHKKCYYVCDELHLRIIARNGRNELKRHGGDLFRAKIFTQNSTYTASSSTDGEIVDNGDGTYDAYFTLKWTGIVNISVLLIESSEATYVLDRIRMEHRPRIVFFGGFVSQDQKTEKEGFCNVQLRNPMVERDFCNFTDPSAGSPWFCERPAGFNCSDLMKMRFDGGATRKQAFQVVNMTEQEAFIVSKTSVPGTIKSVIVIGSNASKHKKVMPQDLPICSIRQQGRQPEVAGYYEQGNWFPPSCQLNRFRDADRVKNCLKNRQLYFMGDSTIRQLHSYYLDQLNLSKSFLNTRDTAFTTSSVIAKDVERNITLFFAFHKYPIFQSLWTFDVDVEYIANRIDEIGISGSPVVVVSIWAHFCSTPPLYYENRVRGIAAAMGRLLDRNKRAVVLFKGANTRQHENFVVHASSSDWYARGSEERMRKIIFRDERIGFIDAWDMTHAQLLDDDVHPTGPHRPNMNDQLLTFLGCRPT